MYIEFTDAVLACEAKAAKLGREFIVVKAQGIYIVARLAGAAQYWGGTIVYRSGRYEVGQADTLSLVQEDL